MDKLPLYHLPGLQHNIKIPRFQPGQLLPGMMTAKEDYDFWKHSPFDYNINELWVK